MPKITIDGVTYASNNSKNPYGQMANAYAKQTRANVNRQVNALTSQLAQSKAGAAANYDSNASQAYLNYAKQQNALPEQLRAQGVNGGASESALTQMQNNYALQQSANNAARATAMAQLQNSYDTNVAKMRDEAEAQILANNLAMAQQQQQYTEAKQAKALEQYQATMERFTSVKQVDKAIKKLKKSDPNYKAKKQLLQLRKAQLKEAASSGGGGGGGGYGGGSYGGGYGSSYGNGGGVSSSDAKSAAKAITKNVTKTAKKNVKTATRSGGRGGSKSYSGGKYYTTGKNVRRGGIW